MNSVINPKSTYFDPLVLAKSDSDLDLGLENLYNLESLGIDSKTNVGTIDQQYIEKFKNAIKLVDGKYHVELPWRENLIQRVPSNHQISLNVLRRVVNNLTNKNLLEKYSEIFNKQLQEGIIRKIHVDPKDYAKYIWVPHRPVIKTSEQCTTKIRSVLNCSLKSFGQPSINDAAYPGVDLMSSLFQLLCSFRSNKYVLLSDVKQAFLQIYLALEEDRNRFCFFWYEDGQLVTYQFNTIVFGLASSPFILNYVIKHHVAKYPDDICTQVLTNNFYVDNLVFTHSDVNILSDVYNTSNKRMAEGGFELRSWNTNHTQLKQTMESEGRAEQHGCSFERVLGYLYNFESDTLKLSEFDLIESSRTKREILSQISKVFDPLGFTLPITIKGRVLMREIWALKTEWDENVNDYIFNKWLKLQADLISLKQFEFERQVFDTSDPNLSLGIFCDASSTCYGFAVYIISSSGSHFLLAKSKVAPLEGRPIPSLELLSVFLAFKCLPQILESFNCRFNDINVFIDAQIVLSWILSGGPKTKQVFVRNRLQDIKSMTSKIKSDFDIDIQYHYVPTDQNPADLITRGLSIGEFNKKLSLWLNGPQWLSSDSVEWPKSQLGCLSHESKLLTNSFNTTVSPNVEQSKLDLLFDITRFSDIHKVHRITLYVYKFINLCRRRRDVDNSALSKLYWLKTVQNVHFSLEYDFLKQPENKEVPKLVNDLNLFIDDDNLIRSKGRISKCNYYDYGVINPILIPKADHFTRLIIWDVHLSCKHLGLSTTLNKIRTSGYWIPCARQIIKNVLSKCVVCHKYNAFTFQYPKFNNFSKSRLNFFKPFKHVACDFTGNVFIKTEDGGQRKMFILVYTCLHIRAVYLDLVPDMSTKSFLLSFKRFTNLYGVCDVFYSDNARSFIQGGEALENSFVSDEFSEHLRVNNIRHIRIPLFSPWMGALWERLIRTVKSCLHKTIGRSILNYFDMITLLSDIQNVINSRPLSYFSSTSNDLTPLTPNSFLKIHSNSALAIKSNKDDRDPDFNAPSRDNLIASLDNVNSKFEYFRSLWYDSYLLSLREFSRDLFQTDWINRIKVNDIVLIKHPSKPRVFWQMGRVMDVIIGDDNIIRVARVRTPSGAVQLYPVCSLYPLELTITHSGGEADVAAAGDTPPEVDSAPGVCARPRRLAARDAAIKIKKQLV